jgi:putative FmdB family regulatory protein
MPIYQYDCAGCERRVDVFFRSVNTQARPTCPECGSRKLTRVMSQFARGRSDYDRLAETDFEEAESILEKGGEREFSRWARQAGAEYDEVLGTNYRELADRTDAGEKPLDRIDAGHTFRHKVAEGAAKIERKSRKSKGG